MRITRIRFVAFIGLVIALAGCVTPSAPSTTRPRPSTITPVVIPLDPHVASPSQTPPRATATAPALVMPTATPEAHQFDYVNSLNLLTALFPDVRFTQNGEEFTVNGKSVWTMWVNSRAEGEFLNSGIHEIAAIIANEAPHMSPAEEERTAPWGSFLAIFESRDGKLQVVQRSNLFTTFISPLTFSVKIARVVDFDHDDQNELLITTEATRMGTSSTAAFLYQWNDQEFVSVWTAPIGDDNTGAINQTRYSTMTSDLRFSDVDGDGMDEIIVDSLRSEYAQDAQGLADVARETGRTGDRRVFRWGGKSFIPDDVRSTPGPPVVTPNS